MSVAGEQVNDFCLYQKSADTTHSLSYKDYIMLTQTQLQEQLHYNKDTGLFNRLLTKRKVSNCENSCGYVSIRVNNKSYKAHRLAWFYVYGYFPKHCIDHINGIRNDNRLCNLREATKQQNCHNQKSKHSHNTTGFMGVDYHKASNKYRARVRLDTKEIHLGLFNTPELAHASYIEAKRKYHQFCTI